MGDNGGALIGAQDASSAVSAKPVGTAVQPCAAKPYSWLMIELVGEDGTPVPNEPYRVMLPDGTIREGTLDSRGIASFEGFISGECTVSFPALDEEAWAQD